MRLYANSEPEAARQCSALECRENYASQCSAVQCSAVQYSAVQCSMPHSAVQSSTNYVCWKELGRLHGTKTETLCYADFKTQRIYSAVEGYVVHKSM